MVKVLATDTEVTTYNFGNPFDSRNHCVCYSFADGTDSDGVLVSPESLAELQRRIDEADVLPLFNAKFDLHWYRNLGIRFDHKRIWDCQLAEFILSNQTWKFPDLDTALRNYGLEPKLDVVKNEYWAKGINTDEIPWDILQPYARVDAEQTLALYHEQVKRLTGLKLKLFNLQCMDLLLLADMEYNGLPYNEELCNTKAEEIEEQTKKIKEQLDNVYPNVPINFGSNDQLSAFLYGGTISVESREHIGFYKTGTKVGQPRYRVVTEEHTLPRQYEPLKGSEMAKPGIYSTSEDTLLKLKGKKGTVQMLLELSKLEKLCGTYYRGLPKLNQTMHWQPGVLHGQFNQCVAATGRLSSSKPNLQNFAADVNIVFESEYD